MESSNAWKVADPIQVPVGPITRARAKKFKEALNGLIHEVWNQVNLCKPIDQGPRQPQRCINLIQILEESTNLAWSRLMKIFISERQILSLVLWRTIELSEFFRGVQKPTYQSSLPSLIVASSIYQGSCFDISNGSRWFPSKSEVETVLVPSLLITGFVSILARFLSFGIRALALVSGLSILLLYILFH